MKNRIITIFTLVLLLASLLIVPTSAVDVPTNEVSAVVSPRYVDIMRLTASIGISSSGKATCYSFAETATSSYVVYLSVSLQRYVNGGWSTVKNWSTNGTGEAILNQSRYVTSGYYYRTAATATVYTSGGSYVESATIYSQSDYY